MLKNKNYLISISILIVLIGGYLIADSILFDGVRPKSIKENGFQANFFAKAQAKNKTTIVLIGGGQWGDYWAQYLAKHDLVGLSLPYVGQEGLPKLPEEIDLAYFEHALQWLGKRPEVNADKIVVMGASRNAELTLVIASTFPNLVRGVVAYAPSSVSWANTVLPYNSDELKASWVYKGNDIPYVPMDKLKGSDSDSLEILEYWKNGLKKTDFVEKAVIQVEKVNGPMLLFSGNDDQVWPASLMADMIAKRLVQFNFQHACYNIKYEHAGHAISSNPDERSTDQIRSMNVDEKNYTYKLGGTQEGNYKAKQQARIKLMNFLNEI